ncbi:MAG: tyrosine-type recombinase/integrase [Planctomycetota bacterium]
MIKVRVVETARDGAILKWIDESGVPRQKKCPGKTRRARDTARRKWEEELNSRSRELTWQDFWHQIDDDYLKPDCSASHRAKCRTMKRRLSEAAERKGIVRLRCSDIDAALLLEVKTELRRIGNEPATMKSNMDTLWSMLTWGQDHDLIPPIARPRKRRGKKSKQNTSRSKSKGRSLTMEEVERMRDAIPLVCKPSEESDGFKRAMDAARLTGMRLSELWLFSWEPIPGAHYVSGLDGAMPVIEFSSEQKSGKEEPVPLTPEAIDWLRKLERRDSIWVCRTRGKRGQHATSNRLGRVIAAAGRRAGVVVKRDAKGEVKKCASLHDLRRTFAVQMFQRLQTVPYVQRMTRHSTAEVLLDFYADAPTPELMAKLRGKK